mmetsp:Transcript_40535/g.97834  ORF Transcript_40535/g.97834 Transcript_40535/m.97834 type:complete len:487 (+) Transcript_40535:216-1676(+)
MSFDTRKKKVARLYEPSDDSSDTSDEILIVNDLEEKPAANTGTPSLTVCVMTNKKESAKAKPNEAKGFTNSGSRVVVHNVGSEANNRDNSEELYSLSILKERTHQYYKHPSPSMLQAKIQTPLVFSAAIQVLLDTQSKIKFRKGTNQIDPNMGHLGQRQLQAYQKVFPPGTMGFAFPKDDKTEKADAVFLQLEGRTIYVVRWELNIPGIVLKCPFCNSGELIHQEYDFHEDATTTALWNPSGDIDFACSMNYKCNECHEQCKANDGRLLASLGAHFSNSYPVDPRYVLPDEPIHLHQSLSRLMEIILVKMAENDESNSVETFAEVLQQLQRTRHAELRNQYLEQVAFSKEHDAASGNVAAAKSLDFPKLDEWRGAFNVPTGNMLKTLADAVAEAKWAKSSTATTNAKMRGIVRSPATCPVAITPVKTAIEFIHVANADVDNHDDAQNISLAQAGHMLTTEQDSTVQANDMLDKATCGSNLAAKEAD